MKIFNQCNWTKMFVQFAYLALIATFVSAGRNSEKFEILNASKERKTFFSPNFPKTPHNLHKIWLIEAPLGKRVEFVIEDGNSEQCCDVIEVRDGYNKEAPLLNILHGRQYKSRFFSTKESLYVKYVTDESIQSSGFQAVYNIAKTSLENCTRDVLVTRDEVGRFSSPHWPKKYTNNLFCTWTFRSQHNQRIRITFTKFLTSGADRVLIQDGVDYSSPYIGYLNGWQSPGEQTFTSYGNTLVVRFMSDDKIQYDGFSAIYESGDFSPTRKNLKEVTKKCGGKFRIESSRHILIETPNWPNIHEANLDCVWTIAAPKNKRVTVYFLEVGTGGCCEDFVVIRQGSSSSSQKLGSLVQEDEIVRSFESHNNKIRIEFKSHPQWPPPRLGRGFRAIAMSKSDLLSESGCGGELLIKRNTRYLSSPQWPDSYEGSLDCTWKISAPSNTRIFLEVLHVTFEKCCDYMEIYDGEKVKGNSGTMLTGLNKGPFKFMSRSNILTVTMKTDPSVGHSGFIAYFRKYSDDDGYAWDEQNSDCEFFTCQG